MQDAFEALPEDLRAAARRFIEAVFRADAAADIDAFLALLTADVTLRLGSQPALTGQAAVRAALGGLFAMLEDGIRHRLIAAWGGADSLAYQAEATLRLRAGQDVALPYVNVVRFAPDGRARDYRIHIDMAPLFQAVA